jgi:hypothetical protein
MPPWKAWFVRIIRAMRAYITRRDKWTQIRIGACALLLPPLTLGAAFYSMLSAPEGGARPSSAAAKAQVVRPEFLRDTAQARAVSPDQQPAAETIQPMAAAAKQAPESGVSVSAAGARNALVAGSAEKAAPVSAPVALQVRSARANPLLPANMDNAPADSPGAELSQSAPVEVSTALLPRVLRPSPPAPPQIQPSRIPATQMAAAPVPLAADPPSAEGAPAPAASKPARPPNLANRGENPAVRRTVRPQRQQAFSLKNWLQQHGILPRSTRGWRDSRGLAVYAGDTSAPRGDQSILMLSSNASRASATLHNVITSIDHALTRPWTITKTYRRDRNELWQDYNCDEANNHVVIGKENYFLSGDGFLMPTKKDQQPPDLRYFKQTRK